MSCYLFNLTCSSLSLVKSFDWPSGRIYNPPHMCGMLVLIYNLETCIYNRLETEKMQHYKSSKITDWCLLKNGRKLFGACTFFFG